MIVFVIPAYNEEENISTLLEGLRQKMESLGRRYHVVVVDDGSTDRTVELARSFASACSLEVMRHPVNRGVAEVFRTGFRRALEIAGPDDILVTKEADNTSDLSILNLMLAKIEEGHDVVLASCYAPQGRVVGSTVDRRLLSFLANLLLRVCFPIPHVHTYSSFYRAYRAQTLREAFAAYQGELLECRGFACMVELLVKLSRLPIRMTEVPMVLQCDLRKGSSKMIRSKTIAEYLRLIAREMLRSRTEDYRVRVAFEALPAKPREGV
jgi:dolichol-phosphate mannosyltransferase